MDDMLDRKSNRIGSEYGITFIDFLFTIAVWIGLAPESHNIGVINGKGGVSGIVSQKWIVNWTYPTYTDLVHLLTFILCILTVVLSWYGYHRAIQKYPHQSTNILGLLRFIIDVLLVVSYTLLMTKYLNIHACLQIIFVIFIMYSFWDLFLVLQYIEKKEDKRKKGYGIWAYKGEFITLLWTVFSFILLLINVHQWILVSLGIVLVISYRIFKIWPNIGPQPIRIYIAGPYSADTEEGKEKNTIKAIDAGLTLYKMGYYPYIPHLTHWIDKRSIETGVKMEWDDYINWDMEWLNRCDAILYLGQSKGADMELAEAKKLGLIIFDSIESVPVIKRETKS